VQAAIRADGSLKAAQEAFVDAEEFVEHIKKTAKALGKMWWIERELAESKKYLPQSKGGQLRNAYWKN